MTVWLRFISLPPGAGAWGCLSPPPKVVMFKLFLVLEEIRERLKRVQRLML